MKPLISRKTPDIVTHAIQPGLKDTYYNSTEYLHFVPNCQMGFLTILHTCRISKSFSNFNFEY